MGRHIHWLLLTGLVALVPSCDNYSVSEDQAESFIKYYALDHENNSGTAVIQTSDGYTILSNYDIASGTKGMLFILTDKFGRQKTVTPVGTSGNDHGYSMIRAPNGYLICGSSTIGTQKQGYLVNISEDGRVLWEKNYNWYQEMEFMDAYWEFPDENFVMTGYIRDGQGNKEWVIFKTSTGGDSIMFRDYRYPDHEVGEAIIEYQNRYLILITSTDVNNPRLSHIRIVNTNTNGLGQLVLPIETPYLSGRDITVNDAGNIYILGNLEDPASRVKKIFLAEIVKAATSNLPELVDSTFIPDNESLYAASFSPVGGEGLAIGGWRIKPNDNDILFLQVDVDNDFQVLARMFYGGEGDQASQHIIFTDPGFVLTGSVELGGGQTSMLLKIDSGGELR